MRDRVHKELKQLPVLGQINPVHAPITNFFMLILMTFPIDPPLSLKNLSQLQIYMHFSRVHFTYGLCPVHFIFRLWSP